MCTFVGVASYMRCSRGDVLKFAGIVRRLIVWLIGVVAG